MLDIIFSLKRITDLLRSSGNVMFSVVSVCLFRSSGRGFPIQDSALAFLLQGLDSHVFTGPQSPQDIFKLAKLGPHWTGTQKVGGWYSTEMPFYWIIHLESGAWIGSKKENMQKESKKFTRGINLENHVSFLRQELEIDSGSPNCSSYQPLSWLINQFKYFLGFTFFEDVQFSLFTYSDYSLCVLFIVFVCNTINSFD